MICARFLGCLEHFRVGSVAFPKTFGTVRFGLIPTFAVQLAGSDSFPGHSQVCFEKDLLIFLEQTISLPDWLLFQGCPTEAIGCENQ